MEETKQSVAKIERYFKGTRYEPALIALMQAMEEGKAQRISECLAKFPTRETLFKELLEKLAYPKPKGKPIYKTLVKLAKGELSSVEEELIAYFSLGTHLSIEIQKGRKEFKMLRDECFEKIGALIFQN